MATLNIGIGLAPFGGGAYGLGLPATAPTPGGSVNRDQYGNQRGSLKISSAATTRGQYVFDSYGRRVGTGDIEHMVTIAFAMVRDSSCVKGLGNRFREVRKVTASFEAEQLARVNETLANLIARQLVKVIGVNVEPRDGKPSVTRVHLLDLTSQNPIDIAI